MSETTSPLPPQNLDAEESVLGAMMLSAKAIEAVRGIVEPGDFYRASHGTIFQAALDLHQQGEPVDAITLAAELERHGQLDEIGGRKRVHEIAALVPAAGNASHYAKIVRDCALRRAAMGELEPILTALHTCGVEQDAVVAALGRVRDLLVRRAKDRFQGLSHADALARELPPARALIANLIESGTLATIAGLPESYKSWLAIETAYKVTAGGLVLGRFAVEQTGPVGYWWQDDSEANELARLQQYAIRHGFTGRLPLRWHLNEGLRLPDDLGAIRAEVEREEQALVVLDSLYNFLGGGGLREEEVGALLAAIKAEVCDATGCAVLIVDHSPWPSDSNRGQRRAYGSVFKAAAVRSTIHLERTDDDLFVEAHGNNLSGLPRTLATWDEEAFELCLDEAPIEPKGTRRDLKAEIAGLIAEGTWRTEYEIATKHVGGVGAKRTEVAKVLAELVASGAAAKQKGPPGRERSAICFRGVVPALGRAGTTGSEGTPDESSADPLSPRRGEGSRDESLRASSEAPDANGSTAPALSSASAAYLGNETG